jgi:predicted Zn-dependent protease
VNDTTVDQTDEDILGMATQPGLNKPRVIYIIYSKHIENKARKHGGENWTEFYEKLLNITIAHELGHGVNLPDHDEQVVCIMNPGPNYDNLDAQTDYCSISPNGCKRIFLLYLDF